jgi:membrane-bound metal-dependent hydrolase YbcI (DUF457 family)
MSSFIAHGLCGFTVYASGRKPTTRPEQLLWAGWLTFLAMSPDIDYALPILRPGGLRLTHSFGFTLFLAFMTAVVLWLTRPGQFKTAGWQPFAATLSHIFCDLLVGVHPLPLFWPFSAAEWVLPFGLLPSAGQINLQNFYFYRNLMIEMGIFLPLVALFLRGGKIKEKLGWWGVVFLLFLAGFFMWWAFTLPR